MHVHDWRECVSLENGGGSNIATGHIRFSVPTRISARRFQPSASHWEKLRSPTHSTPII
jgi:hypothetical protein